MESICNWKRRIREEIKAKTITRRRREWRENVTKGDYK